MGIGNGINRKTLKEIAGENGSVMAVESFDQLANELGEIKDKICGKLQPQPQPQLHFQDFRRLPNIDEDFRGRPEDVSIIHQRIEV